MKTQLLLADAHSLFRYGLRKLLDAEDDLTVVEDVSDGKQALEALETMRADVLITDVTMPRLNGIEAVRGVLKAYPGCRALMLSGIEDSRYVGQALEAGASGFVTKNCSYSELLDAIRAVAAGKTYLHPDVANVVVQRFVRHNTGEGHGNGNGNGYHNGNGRNGRNGANGSEQEHVGPRSLTRREREVLQLLAEGFATKQIAAELSVSVKTIDTHRAAMMRKLEINNIAHLTKYALREGMTTLDY